MPSNLAQSNKMQTFKLWESYWGELYNDSHPNFPTRFYGFENFSSAHKNLCKGSIGTLGTSFGFVSRGNVEIYTKTLHWQLGEGQFFCLPTGFDFILDQTGTSLCVSQRVGFLGMALMGGPIESVGRLRYIDGCSDTLLVSPLLKGDPCQNLLHFPKEINQTAHTHPSARCGVIAKGYGECVLGEEVVPLKPHNVFYIPANTMHKFRTNDRETLDVIAYHPDSDWGPTHEEHPMINRTWVDGKKVSQSFYSKESTDLIKGDQF